MPTTLKVYANEDDAMLFWRITAPIPGCRGFAIERRIKRKGQTQATADTLLNRTGFEHDAAPSPTAAGAKPPIKSSREWPFQRFSWTDHDANTGDEVAYQIVPMVRNATGDLVPAANEASAFSAPRVLGSAHGTRFRPFFNRGFVMAQFMARFLAENKLTLAQFKKNHINQATDDRIRTFLSGDLRLALLEQLQIARDEKTDVFAALFEVADDELIAALGALGKKAHVVLANGSITAAKGEPAATARKRDENKASRAAFRKAKVDLEQTNRFISPGALGHNKFLVRTDKQGKPVAVWTGSTNWAPTGLCTQVNNGLLINDAKVAQVYRDQWDRLRKAASDFPKTLVAANSLPKQPTSDVTVWFTRASKGVDLKALDDAVTGAKDGLLFLMFMPGSAGLFSTVARMSGDPKLFVRGVVSTLPNGRDDESTLDVNLVDNKTHTPLLHLNIVQPEGVKHPFASFAAEVTRTQFFSQVGHAIIHSKVVVVDPFSNDPTVITGSHNFSSTASAKNDENFVIIKGDRALAEAYAVNIEGAYQHYRFRAFLDQTNRPFNGLKDNDTWQAPKLKAALQELSFFGL
jgi:phosphatidylserine/phosphatidylglycerophosphate/cardiolipin synthase-like enzyme